MAEESKSGDSGGASGSVGDMTISQLFDIIAKEWGKDRAKL